MLSEFAGAAAEMGEALLINPFDEDRTSATIERALDLDDQERRQRMRALHNRVLRNNVFRSERLIRRSSLAGASLGAVAGGSLENFMTEGLPEDDRLAERRTGTLFEVRWQFS